MEDMEFDLSWHDSNIKIGLKGDKLSYSWSHGTKEYILIRVEKD